METVTFGGFSYRLSIGFIRGEFFGFPLFLFNCIYHYIIRYLPRFSCFVFPLSYTPVHVLSIY